MRIFLKNEDKLILYTKLILKKPFDRHILSKPENSETQRSSKSKDSNPKLSISSKSRKSSNSSKPHSSSKWVKSSTNSRSFEKLLLEKQNASILALQAEEKFERQIRLIEMKKELEVETE